MKIQVLTINVSAKTAAKPGSRPYQNVELAFKNLDNGKVESKNITQYSSSFKVAADAQPGQVYDVVLEKDKNDYWQWTSMVRDVNGVPAQSTQQATTQNVAPAVRSSYETPEERAKKQVYIVRQSSLAQAVQYLGGASIGATVDEVLNLAQKFTDFVFEKPDLFSIPNDLDVE